MFSYGEVGPDEIKLYLSVEEEDSEIVKDYEKEEFSNEEMAQINKLIEEDSCEDE